MPIAGRLQVQVPRAEANADGTAVFAGGRAGAVGVWWAAVVLALAGLGVTSYLAAESWGAFSEPLGCGAGSGCAAVLGSAWSRVLGIPVSMMAGGAYVLGLVGLVLARPGGSARATGWLLLSFTAGACVLGAIWFVLVQRVWIGAWCPWCLTAHALGLGFAGLVFALAWEARAAAIRPVSAGGVLAVVGTLALAGAQLAWPGQSSVALDLPDGEDYDRTLAGARYVGLLGGRLRLALADEPVLGPPDAEHVIAMMFDYACPHCRATHELLRAMQGDPAQPRFAVILLPTPMNRACNPHAPAEMPERFDESCELARLALAVWRADAARFESFDAWLYEPRQPRSASEARAEAARLVGAGPLEAALADSVVQATLARNTAAFGSSGADRVPVTLVPFAEPRVGAIGRAEVIARMLAAGAEAGESAENAGD